MLYIYSLTSLVLISNALFCFQVCIVTRKQIDIISVLQFVLKTDYNDVPLISNLVKCPPVKFVENYNEEETRTSVEEQLAIIPLYMNPVLLLEPDDHRNSVS